jgi:hypothetical protein
MNFGYKSKCPKNFVINIWRVFFLLDLFLHLFESKWLFEYKIRLNNMFIYYDRTKIIVLESYYFS